MQALRAYITGLEAAITRARAAPKREAVHRLRTFTRRIEAQLLLLDLLAASEVDLPEHAKPARRARRHLRRLRRAAGAVRDLDVARGLLKELGAASGDENRPKKQVKKLRRKLKRRRRKKAGVLQKALHGERHTLAPAVESLLAALEPAKELTIDAARLRGLTEHWYSRQKAKVGGAETADALHAVRKSAKLARYMAENLSPEVGSGTSPLAKAFNDLQDAGGTWHDLLDLTESAARYLGRHSELAELLAARRDEALATYRERLAEFSAQ